MDLYPLLIEPRLDERIWGGHALTQHYGKQGPSGTRFGESWEIYEENRVLNGPLAGQTIGELRQQLGHDLMGRVPAGQLFPLLTKLIDAQDVLSVQVHPDNHFARQLEHQPYGKTECWYIIAAQPDSFLIYGFDRDTNPDEYRRLLAGGELSSILRKLPVRPGDVVYLPARVVHAIGGGIVLFELQQTSDITYRIYDWDRVDEHGQGRELHLDRALQVLDFHRWTRGPVQPLEDPLSGRSMLVAGEYFCLELVDLSAERIVETHGSPVALTALERPVTVTANICVELAPYASALLPANVGTFALNGGGTVLAAWVPESIEATRAMLLKRGHLPEDVDRFLRQFAPV